MLGFSNQTIISKLRTTERAYRWLGAEKENISLNTQQLFVMFMHSTYKGPTVSLDQLLPKNVILFDFDVTTN
jgi:hypothetical protein